MKYLFLLLFLTSCTTTALICTGPKAVGWHNYSEMSEVDIISYELAKLRCQVKYPNSPCLKIKNGRIIK
jgi:hypothetical protein